MAEASKKTLNHDIAGLYSRINRFIEELVKSVSSGLNEFNEFDVQRLEAYLEAISAYQAWVEGAPQLDLPETHPREYALAVDPVIPAIENEAVGDVVRLLVIARDELANSQSARRPAGLVSFDSVRFSAVMEKIQKFLDEFVKKATPIDLPESSPMAAVTGAGKGGI